MVPENLFTEIFQKVDTLDRDEGTLCPFVFSAYSLRRPDKEKFLGFARRVLFMFKEIRHVVLFETPLGQVCSCYC